MARVMTDKELLSWRTERDEVLTLMDVEKFKRFYAKWKRRGVYSVPLPSDEVIEIAMRKMCLEANGIDIKVKREAEAWPRARGFNSFRRYGGGN